VKTRKVPIKAGRLRGVKTVKVRTNGERAVDAKSTIAIPMRGFQRILRSQAQYRWILPSLAAITPQWIEMILRGALAGNHVQQWQLFDLMLDTWPELAACQQELLYGINRRDIIFDPYVEEDQDPTANAVEREKLCATAILGMQPDAAADENGLDGTVTDIMDGWFRGFSVLEILWQMLKTKNHGLIAAPRCTCWAHPISYAFDQNGVLGLTYVGEAGFDTSQLGPQSYQSYQYNQGNPAFPGYPQSSGGITPFPDYKFLSCIHKVKSGSPLGGPMLRPLAWWWCAANFSSDWLLNLAQVFGLPFRWATYVGTSPDQTVSALCDMLQNMGSAGWAAFPEGTKLELKEPTHSSGDRTPQGDLLDRADRYARHLILGQTMTGATLASGRGGQAFGTVEAQLKQDRLDAASAYVADVINGQLIPYILMLNYGDAEEPPECRFLQETTGTYQDAERDQILAAIGLDLPLSYLRTKYGIPQATEGEDVAHAPPPKGAGPPAPTAAPPGVTPLGEPSHNPPANPREANVSRPHEAGFHVQARLERLSQIEDDGIFAHELRKLAAELTQKETK
jgi:phage gp29-like protein